VRFFQQFPFIKRLQQRHLLLPTIVLAAVLGVLLHGAFSHERDAEASVGNILDLPAPPSLPNLRPNLEKTPLTYLSDYYLQLGDQARNKLVLVGQQRLPGLVVVPGVILTSIRAADESMGLRLQQRALRAYQARQTDGQEAVPPSNPEGGADLLVIEVSPLNPEASPQRIPLIAADAELGIALLQMEQPYIAPPFSPVDPAVLTPGSRVLAVTLLPDERLEITPGYLTSPGTGQSPEDGGPLHVSITFPQPPPVAAIVDLDGRLVGAAVESGDSMRLLSSNQVLQIVDRLREGIPCRAIEVSDLTDTVRGVLQLNGGVLVEKVREEAFRPEPSIRPGDLLLQWDGQAISTAEQFNALYDSGRPAAMVRFRVLRDQKRINGATVMPGPDCRPARQSLQVLPALGLTVQWVTGPGEQEPLEAAGGWQVLSVTAGSPTSAAGVQPGDVISGVNGKRLDETQREQQLRRMEKTPRPFVLTLRRGDRVKFVAIPRESE
jgi:PDZ domain